MTQSFTGGISPASLYDYTGLHSACTNADLDKIRALLKDGDDPNARTSKTDGSETCLHKLIGSSMLSTSFYNDENLALFSDTFLGDTIQALIDAGADVNAGTIAKDYNSEVQNYTALHFLASSDPKGWKHACDVLLDNGADPTIRTKGGYTPMELGRHVNIDGEAHKYLDAQCGQRGIQIDPRAAVKILYMPQLTTYGQTLSISETLKPLGFDIDTIEGNLGPQFINKAVIYEAKDGDIVEQIYAALEPYEFSKYYKRIEIGSTPENAVIIFMK